MKDLFKIGETTHYPNGDYSLRSVEVDGNGKIIGECGIRGSIYEFEDIVSAQFNQLKGKLYNLVESTATNEIQLNAMKGLVKDFCNEKYRNTIGDLRRWVKRMGFNIENYPQGSEPLENN